MSAGDELKLVKVKGRGKCGVRSGVMFVVPQRVGKSGEGGGAGIGPPKMGRLVICRDSCRGSDVLRGARLVFQFA